MKGHECEHGHVNGRMDGYMDIPFDASLLASHGLPVGLWQAVKPTLGRLLRGW